MNEKIKQDILAVLKESIKLIEQEEFPAQGLLETSNKVIHNASVYQDEDSIYIAVLIYALSKTIQHCCEKELPFKKFSEPLKRMFKYLSQNNLKLFRREISISISTIRKTDEKLKAYVQEVLDRAKIKKGSKLHEHGISIARTAAILGITQWELQEYIGTQPEFAGKTMPAIQRLEIARNLFEKY